MSINIKKLDQINNHVEKLDKRQHIEILKILNKKKLIK